MDASDPLNERARRILETNRDLPYVSSELVLAETVTLIRRELGASTATAFGRDFLGGKVGRILTCEPSDWREGFSIMEKFHEHRISAADATSFALVRRLDVGRVASFDRQFRIVLNEREVVDGG